MAAKLSSPMRDADASRAKARKLTRAQKREAKFADRAKKLIGRTVHFTHTRGGQVREFTGKVINVFSSGEARKQGLTKSRRRRGRWVAVEVSNGEVIHKRRSAVSLSKPEQRKDGEEK